VRVTPPASDAPGAVSFHENQIIETSTRRIVSQNELLARVNEQDVVYLGEEHHNRFHIEISLTILRHLIAMSRRPVLAMEMFGWDSQTALDQYVSPIGLPKSELLDKLRWQQNWGGPFEDYEALALFARDQHLALIAMNPPKGLVRAVAKQGIEQARRDDEMIRWHMDDETVVDDAEYRSRILGQLRACHDGGPDAMYQAMYEASMVRDEGMARTVAEQVQRIRNAHDRLAGPVVSYTGGGHIQYNLPVPKRVARRTVGSVRQLTIYMTSYDTTRRNEVLEMIGENIADYVWLTPIGSQGPPRRCR